MSAQGSSRMGESERGPGKGEAYGAASVTNVLEGISFPASKDELIKRFGREQIRWTKDSQPFPLEECLRQVNRDQFNSVVEITSAISEVAARQGLTR